MSEYIQPNQKISFYNVTGIIERDKNIFFFPRVEDLLEQQKDTVCESYKSLFDVVCPPFSDFTDKSISQWNPLDRRLKVNCSVDYFRKGSAGRITLNYAILEVTKGIDKFYYGYFITDARQDGINSCWVSLILDEFTNVCYLSNMNRITSDFNPLKSFISNAFVERQHYDRVKVTESYHIIDGDVESPSSLEVGKHYTLIPYLINEEDSTQYEDPSDVSIQFSLTRLNRTTYYNNLKVVKRDANWNVISSMLICGIRVDFYNRKIILYRGNLFQTEVVEEISFDTYFGTSTFITFSFESNQYFRELAESISDFTFKSLVSEPENHNQLSDFANMDLFVKTEESYNYRQLFKDMRIPLEFNTQPTRNGSDNVVNKIPAEAYTKKTVAEARAYLHYLCSEGVDRLEEADAICRACIHYLHIITNEQITYPTIIEGDTGDSTNPKQYYQAWYNKDFEVENDFPSASQHIVIPFIAEVKGLEAFARYLDGEWIPSGQTSEVSHGIAIRGYYKGVVVGGGVLTYYDSKSFSEYLSTINNKYGYYIQSMFVTPYSELPCGYDWETDSVVFNGALVNEDTEPISPLIRKRRAGTWWTGYTYKKIYSPTKVIEDYDDAVISSPTLVMLPFEKIELNANQTEFASTPDVMFKLIGTISTPTGMVLNTYDEQGETKTYYDKDILGFGFLVGTKGYEHNVAGEIKKQVVDLEYSVGKEDLIRSYYEPVLEMEPYSFYSISMSEIEAPLDRKRYYQMDNGFPYFPDFDVFYRKSRVPLYYNQAVNTMVKIGVIPEYTINGITQRYYSDELMFVTTSGVTVKVDSFASFMYVMSPQLKAQSHLAVYNAQRDMEKSLISGLGNALSGAVNQNPAGAIQGLADIINQQITNEQNIYNVQTNIKAQKASAGNKADTFLQAGSDYIYELNLDEYCVMLNHYRIDELSYNSIAKMLERYGYYVRRYDELNCFNRKGYNFIKLVAFDFDESYIKLNDSQMNTITQILREGVTLLHEKDYLHTNLHNYEVVLELVESSN